MATASAIIDRAYGLLGYKDAGEALSGADADYALNVLNDMIDSWNTNRLFIFTTQTVTSTVIGVSSSIGPGLTIDTPRPTRIPAQGSFVSVGGVDYPIEFINDAQYNGIAIKSTPSTIPIYAHYDNGVPGRIFFWPFPSVATSFTLLLEQQLTSFADLATDVPLVPGYKKALQESLAEELAPGLREIPAALVRSAAKSRQAIRRTNANVPLLSFGETVGSPFSRFIAG